MPSHLLSNVVGSPSLWTAFHHRCAPRFLALWTLSSIRSFGRLLGMTFTSKKNRGDHNKSGTTKPIRFLESFFLSESLKQPNPLPLVIVHTIFFRQKCVCQWLPPNPKEKKAKKTAATTTTTTARLTHLQTFPPRFRMVVTVPFFLGDRLRMIPKQDGRSARSSWKHTVPWAFFFQIPRKTWIWLWKNGEVFWETDLWIIVFSTIPISAAPPNLTKPYGFCLNFFQASNDMQIQKDFFPSEK